MGVLTTRLSFNDGAYAQFPPRACLKTTVPRGVPLSVHKFKRIVKMEEEVRLFVCWDECSAQRLAGVNKDETTANELYRLYR